MAEFTRSNITNLAKPTFDKFNKGTTSSDYLKNKIAYCNGSSCGNMSRVRSYDEKNLMSNGKYLSDIDKIGINPNYKYDLGISLFTTLDLNGTYVVTDVSNNEPTCIDISLIPFYESYNIDTDNSLFGDSKCNTLNYVNYMTPNLNYVPPTKILFNRS
jgi:hypothetical protein